MAYKTKNGCRINTGKNLMDRHLAKSVVGMVVVCFCLGKASSTELHGPGQTLPPACLHKMRRWYNDCPSPEHLDFEERYKTLNSTCCNGFLGKDFHCFTGYDRNGHQFSMIACVPSLLVDKHHLVKFQNYSSSEPSLHLYLTNDSDHGEWTERWSWKVTYLYPTDEKGCRGVGQEVLCEVEEYEDNNCTCAEGFTPNSPKCMSGFSQSDPHCWCKTCQEGHVAVRSFLQKNVLCKNLAHAPEFTCKPQAVTVDAVTGSTVGTTGLSTPKHPTADGPSDGGFPIGKESNESDSDTSHIMLAVLSLIAIMVLLLLGMIFVLYRDKIVQQLGSWWNKWQAKRQEI